MQKTHWRGRFGSFAAMPSILGFAAALGCALAPAQTASDTKDRRVQNPWAVLPQDAWRPLKDEKLGLFKNWPVPADFTKYRAVLGQIADRVTGHTNEGPLTERLFGPFVDRLDRRTGHLPSDANVVRPHTIASPYSLAVTYRVAFMELDELLDRFETHARRALARRGLGRARRRAIENALEESLRFRGFIIDTFPIRTYEFFNYRMGRVIEAVQSKPGRFRRGRRGSPARVAKDFKKSVPQMHALWALLLRDMREFKTTRGSNYARARTQGIVGVKDALQDDLNALAPFSGFAAVAAPD